MMLSSKVPKQATEGMMVSPLVWMMMNSTSWCSPSSFFCVCERNLPGISRFSIKGGHSKPTICFGILHPCSHIVVERLKKISFDTTVWLAPEKSAATWLFWKGILLCHVITLSDEWPIVLSNKKWSKEAGLFWNWLQDVQRLTGIRTLRGTFEDFSEVYLPSRPGQPRPV